MTKKDKSTRVKKPFFKKWWFWVIIVMLLFGAFGSGGSGSKGNNDSKNAVTETTETNKEEGKTNSAKEAAPKQSEAKVGAEDSKDVSSGDSSNPMMNCEVKEAEVKSGSGKLIGTRGYIELPSGVLASLTDEQIAEFALNVVDGAGYNYFTVDFGNGKGIVFPGCLIEAASVGDIDETGGIVSTEKYLYVSKDGSVKMIDANEQETVEDAKTPTVNDSKSAESAEPKETEEVSSEYKNALKKAEQYSSLMHMSKQGIYDQLTSEYGENFPADAAQYAVDHVNADWNANALAKARTYQKTMSMSVSAIYDQLVSEYGEKFTAEEAKYAIEHLNDSDGSANASASGGQAENGDSIPVEYQNALRKAEQYSSLMHMSKHGIYDQLTSEYGEKFPADAAQYAVDNVDADWKANALAKAKEYQETMSMSASAIYDQLVSEYGEKFTAEEAQYAIEHLD